VHDIAIFDRAGRLLGEPTYGSEGDAKDYSNQPVMAPSGLRKVRTIFLAESEEPCVPIPRWTQSPARRHRALTYAGDFLTA